MISEMAREDLAALRAEGVRLTDEQVIRLNSLGLLVERGPHSGEVFAAPRVGWAGPVAIHEPTIQSSRWYVSRACDWWCGDSLFWALAWACAHAPRRGWFARWQTEGLARAAVERWASALTCTTVQLQTALQYAVSGTAPDDVQPGNRSSASPDGCPFTDLVNEALAAGLGLTPERIERMPRRAVVDILRRYTANQIALAGGGEVDLDKGAKTAAYVVYDDYLISLRAGGAQIYG